jgi:hypothetical protein
MIVSNLTEGLRSIGTLMKLIEGGNSNTQRAAVTREGVMKMFVCYKETLEKKMSLPQQISMLHFLKSGSTPSPILTLRSGRVSLENPSTGTV